MFYFNEQKKAAFLSKSSKQKLMTIDYILRKGFEDKEAQEAIELLGSLSFIETGLTLEQYKRYLRSLSQLILIDNDQVTYLEGIKTLKKCYREVHVRNSYKALIDAFARQVYKAEGKNMLGFSMWMDDAVKMGVITPRQRESLIKKYDKRAKVKLATLEEEAK